MSEFNPGPGWREVSPTEIKSGEQEYLKHNTAETVQVWVPVEPVPPLPTVPYTVIRITKTNGETATACLLRDDDGTLVWRGLGLGTEMLTAGLLLDRITGFEVLSEPRAVTAKAVNAVIAKAVLDRVAECWTGDARIHDIAREFGVES